MTSLISVDPAEVSKTYSAIVFGGGGGGEGCSTFSGSVVTSFASIVVIYTVFFGV